jgi:Ser/Thr protein kinase RdoA (MazF antagonist)
MEDSTPHSVAVGDSELTGQFFSLTPERVLDAVEEAGSRTTGSCYVLNSMENRVFDVELEEGERVIVKFYRPGRWSRETILDEHRLLKALVDNEIPAVPTLPFPDGDTLHQNSDGIFFALFPRVGGRSPDELSIEEYRELGRLLGRIHNVAAKSGLVHRPAISPATYGTESLALLQSKTTLPESIEQKYCDAVKRIVDIGEQRYQSAPSHIIHGDCHKGNLLRGGDGAFFFLDFDDMGAGPAAQDFWLLLPARRADSKAELEALMAGYEIFREPHIPSLNLIEVLRPLRYVRYAAWIANRWQDPTFPRAFPDWGTEIYWQNQLSDLYEQLQILQEEDVTYVSWE